ncbi:MAG: hypothetical protein ACRERE_04795 [Candidatus Entotheonellia bacterium]
MGGGPDDDKAGNLGDLLKSSRLHLTGNQDSMSIDYFIDTHHFPMVLNVPPELPGFLDDMWERPVLDILPSGRSAGMCAYAGVGVQTMVIPGHTDKMAEILPAIDLLA